MSFQEVFQMWDYFKKMEDAYFSRFDEEGYAKWKQFKLLSKCYERQLEAMCEI